MAILWLWLWHGGIGKVVQYIMASGGGEWMRGECVARKDWWKGRETRRKRASDEYGRTRPSNNSILDTYNEIIKNTHN
ncbi:hypothetical protein BKA61DRAFT_205075, partial [Leptodontidium sp. MPI-SDFR-AT-0119]